MTGDEHEGERYLAIKVVMMPRDTNPFGTIFGGVTLSYIDLAGAVGAEHEARRCGWPEHPLVSVAMNCVEFHEPVFVGDVVSFWTRVFRVGRTSVTVHVDVEADRNGDTVHLTDATVTYVAVDSAQGRRRPVPVREAESANGYAPYGGDVRGNPGDRRSDRRHEGSEVDSRLDTPRADMRSQPVREGGRAQ